MKRVDKKYLFIVIAIAILIILYLFFENKITPSLRGFLRKETWVIWCGGICIIVEMLYKLKYEFVKYKLGGIVEFFKNGKDLIDIIIEPGILISSIHLLRGCSLYLFLGDKSFFPEFSNTVIVCLAIISVYAFIHAFLIIKEHFTKLFLNTPHNVADVAVDDTPADE